MDPELKGLATQMGYGTMVLKDTAILEFDFVPLVTGSFSFKYVFGSDEFPEYAPPTSSSYNDIFGFWITGGGTTVNIAMVPGTSTPVGISTINPGTNAMFYQSNTPATLATEMDGLSLELETAMYAVTAGSTYHIKLGIADGYDNKFDSLIWVKYGSFSFNFPPPPPPSPPPPPPPPSPPPPSPPPPSPPPPPAAAPSPTTTTCISWHVHLATLSLRRERHHHLHHHLLLAPPPPPPPPATTTSHTSTPTSSPLHHHHPPPPPTTYPPPTTAPPPPPPPTTTP
eukprot:jgi/Chrzof1/2293/Cz11g09330.t1